MAGKRKQFTGSGRIGDGQGGADVSWYVHRPAVSADGPTPAEAMSDFLLNSIQQPFTWGLLLGLLVAGFLWKSGFSKARELKRETKRLQEEMRDLQTHLNTQLKINASGNEAVQSQLEELRRQNENLRVNFASLQHKPGRAEMRALRAQEAAIAKLREQAPGFAAAWEKALREAEADLDAAESGLMKLVKRVMPSLGAQAGATVDEPARIGTEAAAEEAVRPK